VIGLATVRRLKGIDRAARSTTAIGDVATPLHEVAVVALATRMVDVLGRLDAGGDGRLLVMDGDEVVGIISPTDLVRLLELRDLRPDRERTR
jgi:CBS domain-containing protein